MRSRRVFTRVGKVWDAFFLYGADAAWDGRPPAPLAAGAPVVRDCAVLREA